MKANMTVVIMFFILIASVCQALGHGEHDFCVRNNTGETLEVCIYPQSDTADSCFFVKDDGRCDLRVMYFENQCGYDLCAYGADSDRNYGCIRNTSCESAGYVFRYGGGYVCDNPYCGNYYVSEHFDDDLHTAVYCFVSALPF